jgi:hypothetical protein
LLIKICFLNEQKLTGGVLLGRDKYFITIYRGKDFLPRQLAFALTERVTMLRTETVGEDHITIKSDKDINVGKPNGRSKLKRGESMISRHLMFSENLKRKLAAVSATAPFSEYKIVRFWNC